MKVLSYNVATGKPSKERAEEMISSMLYHDPDIIGTQEVNSFWIEYFEKYKIFDKYNFIGKPRLEESDLGAGNEYSAILYKKDKFNVIDSGTLWLTSTPETISKIEESAYTRIMTYALFERIEDKKRFLHVNTHVDYVSYDAQVKILLTLTKNLGYDLPTFFTGDFNMWSDCEGYKMMTEICDDSRSVARKIKQIDEYKDDKITGFKQVIDYCFLSKGDFNVNEHSHDALNGSDHYPVFIDFEIK